jgi:TIR domain
VPGIFISYRREDSPGYAGRLRDRLNERFGSNTVFRDIDSIAPGIDFVDQIGKAVGSCDVLLAVIGNAWLTASNKDGQKRLYDPHDFVRQEIQEALSRKIRVIPVLVAGASMPSADDLPSEINALARKQALELSDSRWDYDVERLLSFLDRPEKQIHGALVGMAIALILMLFLVGLSFFSRDPLDRTVINVSFVSLPLLGLLVGALIPHLQTKSRGAIAGATIGGLNTVVAWCVGVWLSRGANLPAAEPMEVFKSVMLYLPGTTLISGLVGWATVSIRKFLLANKAKRWS